MARPKTKGPPVNFRLPLTADRALRDAAAREGLSLSAYVAEVVLAGLPRADLRFPIRDESNTRTMTGTVTPPTAACAHKAVTLIAGGMAKCKDCGAVRGADRRWRG